MEKAFLEVARLVLQARATHAAMLAASPEDHIRLGTDRIASDAAGLLLDVWPSSTEFSDSLFGGLLASGTTQAEIDILRAILNG